MVLGLVPHDFRLGMIRFSCAFFLAASSSATYCEKFGGGPASTLPPVLMTRAATVRDFCDLKTLILFPREGEIAPELGFSRRGELSKPVPGHVNYVRWKFEQLLAADMETRKDIVAEIQDSLVFGDQQYLWSVFDVVQNELEIEYLKTVRQQATAELQSVVQQVQWIDQQLSAEVKRIESQSIEAHEFRTNSLEPLERMFSLIAAQCPPAARSKQTFFLPRDQFQATKAEVVGQVEIFVSHREEAALGTFLKNLCARFAPVLVTALLRGVKDQLANSVAVVSRRSWELAESIKSRNGRRADLEGHKRRFVAGRNVLVENLSWVQNERLIRENAVRAAREW